MRRPAAWILLPTLCGGAAQAQPAVVTPAIPGIDPIFLQLLNERDRQYGLRFDAERNERILAVNAVKEFLVANSAAAKEAVQTAQVGLEKRFDSVNEFRNTLKDQQSQFATKGEMQVQFNAVNERLHRLTSSSDQSTGWSASMLWIIGVLLLAANVVIAAVSMLRRGTVPH